MAENSMNVGIFISDLLEKTRVDDTDVLITEDTENTKKVMFRNFRISLIEDNESPAPHRIYSSSKVNELLKDMQNQITDGVGGVQGDIEDLKENSVTHKELDKAIAEIDEKKLDKVDLNPVVEELENTRKKTGQCNKLCNRLVTCTSMSIFFVNNSSSHPFASTLYS